MRKCQNCGKDINDDEIFCTSCGTKIVDEQENNNDVSKKSKINSKIIIGIVLGIVVVIAGIYFFTKPLDVELEAKKLASMIEEEKSSEYYGDNLHIHGYLVRDFREYSKNEELGYYMLVSDVDNLEDSSNVLIFTYEKELDEEIGTGSEVIVHGKLKEKTDESLEVLVAEEVEIKKRKEPIFQLDFEELDKEYIGEKIQINGRLIDLLGDGHYIADFEIENALQLKGLTEAEFAKCFRKGSVANVIGILNEDGTLDVEEIIQNEYTEEMSYDFGYSVSECYDTYIEPGTEVTIQGIYLKNPTGSVDYAIGDEETSQFIDIRNANLDEYFESREQCVITGYIMEGGTGYYLDVTAVG